MRNTILFLTRSLEIGGMEKVIVLLANNLMREHFEPLVCCISEAGDMSKALKRDVKLYIMGNSGRINLKSYRYIHQLIRKESIALIHAHEISALLYGLPIAKINRVPIVYTKHGYKPGQEHWTIRIVEKWFSRSVSEFVCVSTELKDKISKTLGVQEGRLSVIYNGINIDSGYISKNRSDTRNIIIGSVGRLTEAKNYSLLIDVFRDIYEKYPECRLEMVGGGELEDELKTLTENLGLEDIVSFHGFISNVSDYLDRFDIFVLTSIREGHSISLLEALGKRKICVVSDVGGNTEIISDGENGLIFRSEDRADLMIKLSSAIEGLSSEGFEMMRNKALESVQMNYSVESMVNKYEALYLKHIKNN